MYTEVSVTLLESV